MRMLIVAPFRDEATFLPRFLRSLERQTRRPDRLVLVDDGSADDSAALARAFAERHAWATLLARPRRPAGRDRLARAAELAAFQWALARADDGAAELVGKLDADLELTPGTFAALEAAFAADPRLGISGALLSVRDADGTTRRERCPPGHVRGATKLYRRACLEAIAPVPAILGWDTIDEAAARLHGWRTASMAIPGGDPLHLRPTGAASGLLRAQRRWGTCAWAIGAHPAWVALSALRRAGERPRVLSGAAFAAGWALAPLRGVPRADAAVRRQVRREQRSRLRDAGLGLSRPPAGRRAAAAAAARAVPSGGRGRAR